MNDVLLPPTKEEVNVFARVRLSVCLSVCLLARLLKKTCMDLDEMLRVDRCRDMDELINIIKFRVAALIRYRRKQSGSGIRTIIRIGLKS